MRWERAPDGPTALGADVGREIVASGVARGMIEGRRDSSEYWSSCASVHFQAGMRAVELDIYRSNLNRYLRACLDVIAIARADHEDDA